MSHKGLTTKMFCISQDGTAMGSLGLDSNCPHAVRQSCPEAHLLQFAKNILEEPVPPEVSASGCRVIPSCCTLPNIP